MLPWSRASGVGKAGGGRAGVSAAPRASSDINVQSLEMKMKRPEPPGGRVGEVGHVKQLTTYTRQKASGLSSRGEFPPYRGEWDM